MKTITMDFEIYCSEIVLERQNGARMGEKVIAEIYEIFSALNSHSGAEKFNAAKIRLSKILYDLEIYHGRPSTTTKGE